MPDRLFLWILLLAFGCTNSPLLPGFDTKQWQADIEGCRGERAGLAQELINRKAELSGRGQNSIVAVLGKPDRHELYSRNKKAFVYFTGGGPNCEKAVDNPGKLVIRFDGIGRAKEIILYPNKP